MIARGHCFCGLALVENLLPFSPLVVTPSTFFHVMYDIMMYMYAHAFESILLVLFSL